MDARKIWIGQTKPAFVGCYSALATNSIDSPSMKDVRLISFGGPRGRPLRSPCLEFAAGQSWIKCASLPHALQT